MDQHDKEPSIWSHPYLLYILATLVLFLGLAFIGWLAWTNGWIPNRGISVKQG